MLPATVNVNTQPIVFDIMRLWFVLDIWRYKNVFWLIDWLIDIDFEQLKRGY